MARPVAAAVAAAEASPGFVAVAADMPTLRCWVEYAADMDSLLHQKDRISVRILAEPARDARSVGILGVLVVEGVLCGTYQEVLVDM